MATASSLHSAAETITLRCPAKVNLALSVGGATPNGLHPIMSWMIAVDFGDELTLERTGGESSTFDIAFADDAPRREEIDWPLHRDLAVRAHTLLETNVGRPLPVKATIRKRIPTGAGLGGGSSNAGGMLVALNHLFQLDLDDATLTEVSRQLGNDVGFLTLAIRGRTSATVGGLGGVIEAAPLRAPTSLVLILPPIHCPTPLVYQAFDKVVPQKTVLQTKRVRELAATGRVDSASLFNDLTEPAMHVRPELRSVRDQVTASLGHPVHITGSGAALYLIAASPDEAVALAEQIQRDHNIPTVATSTLDGPVL